MTRVKKRKAERELMALDWTNSTEADRKVVYECVRGLIDAGKLDWPTVYTWVGRTAVSEDFLRNFQRGKLAARSVALICQGLALAFPWHADRLEERLIGKPPGPQDQWRAMIVRIGQEYLLSPVETEGQYPPPFVAVEKFPPGITMARQYHEFYLQLIAPIGGIALCLRQRTQRWFLEPPSQERFWRNIAPGNNWIGSDTVDGKLMPLKNPNAGVFQYGALIVQDDALPDWLVTREKIEPGIPLADSSLEAIASRIGEHSLPAVFCHCTMMFSGGPWS